MKTGKSITELAMEIERQQNAKRDFVAPTDHLEVGVKSDEKTLTLTVGKNGSATQHGLNRLALQQIAEHTSIPQKYMDLMALSAPELLARNVNHWFHKNPDDRMVRTMDGNVRAFLSNRYRPLENADLAEAVLPVLLDQDLEIVSSEITERRLYIKAVDKRINLDIPHGHRMGDGSHQIFDTVAPAIIITNSEVGLGRLGVETGIWTRACTNMAIFKQRSMSKYHVGAKHELSDGIYELLSDETKKKTDLATWAQVGDVVKAAFDRVKFEASVNLLKGLVDQPIQGDPVKVVEFAAKKFTLNDGERKSILTHLIRGGELTRYGFFNAITRTAEDLADYDRATDFERLGGAIIDLPQSEWKVLSEVE